MAHTSEKRFSSNENPESARERFKASSSLRVQNTMDSPQLSHVNDINVQDTVVSKNEDESEKDVGFDAVQIADSQPSIFCDSNIISNDQLSPSAGKSVEPEQP